MGRATRSAALFVGLVAGCTRPANYAVLYAPYPAEPDSSRAIPNLVLGPSVDHARLAELFTARSWPHAVPAGYRFDDESYYNELTYDDQFFFDSLGGAYFRSGQTLRSGVLVR